MSSFKREMQKNLNHFKRLVLLSGFLYIEILKYLDYLNNM